MTTYKELKRKYLMKEITEEEYKRKEELYLRKLYDLYFQAMISETEFRELTKG